MLFVAAFHDTVKRFFIGSTPDGLPSAAAQSKITPFVAYCCNTSPLVPGWNQGRPQIPPRRP